MKRIISVLAVAVLMAVVLLAMALPAFADEPNFGQCHKDINEQSLDSNSEFNELFNPLTSQGNQEGTLIACFSETPATSG